jgi:hypothetical protein
MSEGRDEKDEAQPPKQPRATSDGSQTAGKVSAEKAATERKDREPIGTDAESTSTESDEVSEDEEEGDLDWQPTQKEAIEAALADLRALPALKRYRVILAASFVVFYLGMMLLRGLHENHIKPVLPYVVWYFDGLGLARTWGMFAHPSTELPVFVYGVTNDEKEVRLSPPAEDSFAIRIRDQRMRKVRSHMANKDQRGRWGADLSQYFCRASAEQGVKLRFVRIKEINRMGQDGEAKTLLQTRCKG